MEINNEIIDWIKRQKLNTMDPSKQMLKLIEELGELASSMCRGNEDGIKDAIGDVYISLLTFTIQGGYDINECVKNAFGEIYNRDLRLVDGYFVKSTDIE